MNFGLINKPNTSTDDFFGAISRSDNVIVNESGDWTAWLPIPENQSGYGFDCYGCVSFSALNCIETLLSRMGIVSNLSDRFLAKMSGTLQGVGNTVAQVADTIRHKGDVDESVWPYDRKTMNSWDKFYSEIPQEVKDEALDLLKHYEITYEFVRYADIKEALKYAPLQVGVYAWLDPVNGVYPCDKDKPQNHLVMLFKYDDEGYPYIFDHYNQSIKKLAKDFRFGSVLRYSVRKTQPPMLEIKNNSLIQQIPGSGEFGIYIEGNIFIDDLAKILATWHMRNGVDKAIVSKKIWDSVPHMNLKRELI